MNDNTDAGCNNSDKSQYVLYRAQFQDHMYYTRPRDEENMLVPSGTSLTMHRSNIPVISNLCMCHDDDEHAELLCLIKAKTKYYFCGSVMVLMKGRGPFIKRNAT